MEKIIEEISSDLIKFKDYILEEEGKPSDYDWEIIDSIYEEHGNSVADIIEGYLYSCADFVQDDKALKIAKDYFEELIYYYKDFLSKKEKKGIIKTINYLLSFARDLAKDNFKVIDVWCIILRNIMRLHLFNRDNLIDLNDIGKNYLKTVFFIIAKIIKEDPDAKIHYDKCKFVSQKKSLYEEALKIVFK